LPVIPAVSILRDEHRPRRAATGRGEAMKLGQKRPRKWLDKKARAGMRGYPIGTVAFYGPDDRRASKVAVGIIPEPESEPIAMEAWFAAGGDLRNDAAILAEVVAFLQLYGARTIAMPKKIIGCPHQEGTDYPEGQVCPQCPFWAGHDRRGRRDAVVRP
jgi:hypothetical protein